MQFLPAKYIRDDAPDFSLDSLLRHLGEFAHTCELGEGFDSFECEGEMLICARSFASGGDYYRVWYCSDRRNLALVTYVCSADSEGVDDTDCEQMIADLQFVA
jgi:hypothetical protein